MAAIKPESVLSETKCSSDALISEKDDRCTISCQTKLYGKLRTSQQDTPKNQTSNSGDTLLSNVGQPSRSKAASDKDSSTTNPSCTEDTPDESNMENGSDQNDSNFSIRSSRVQQGVLSEAKTDSGEKNSSSESENVTLNNIDQRHCSDEDAGVAGETSELTRSIEKPHLPNFLQVETTTSSSRCAPSNGNHRKSSISSPTSVEKKKVQPNSEVKAEPQDDIKEYAETTMNELLGWYGLSKLDKADTTRLALSSSLPASSTEDTPINPESSACGKPTSAEDLRTGIPASSHAVEKAVDPNSIALASETEQSGRSSRSLIQSDLSTDKIATTTCKSTLTSSGVALPAARPNLDTVTTNSRSPSRDGDSCRRVEKIVSVVTPEPLNDSNNNSDHFIGNIDSDDDDSVDDGDHEDDEISDEIRNLASPDIGPSDLGSAIVCSWCQKDGTKLFTLATPAGIKAFCSEVCFTQCRRASFKKNKVCDWCKHVRHTVNFVDLQEGDMQLQFCTEKCLNQYKMNIFCTEARQHLEQIEKMTGDGNSKLLRTKESKGEILITPELWLSGTSNDAREIKKEKPDVCSDDENDDGVCRDDLEKDMRNGNEEKEPGELREKESSIDHLRVNMVGASEDRQGKTPHQNNTFACKKEKQHCRAFEHRLPSYTSVYSSRESPGTLTSPNVSDTSFESRGRNRRRSRERIRKLLVGEPVNRSPSPQDDRRYNEMASRRYPHSHIDSNTKRAAPTTSSSEAILPEQQLLGHPMFHHWATSQLLAMLPSVPHSLPTPLSAPSAASQLANLGYVAGAPQMLYPGLFGPPNLRLPAAASSLSAHSHFGTIPPRGSDALRSETAPSTLPSRHPAGDGCNSQRSANPSPLSHSSSNSSAETPIPSTVQPTPPLAPGIAQAMACSNGLPSTSVNDIRALQSYLLNTSRLPSGPSSSLPHAQNLSQVPGFSVNASSTQPEMSHPASRNPVDGSTTRHPPSSSQSQPTSTQTLPSLFPQTSGVPPVTVLVPYPVAVPIPIPIPIPLPISPEKLFAFFEEKSKASTSCSSTAKRGNVSNNVSHLTRHRSRSSSSSGSKMSSSSPICVPSSAPRYPSWTTATSDNRALSTSSTASSRGDHCLMISNEHGEASDSISMLRHEIGKSAPPDFAASTFTTTASQSLKRPRNASPHQMLSTYLSKRNRPGSPSYTQDEDNEAMDLRKPSSRTESPPSDQNCSQMRRLGARVCTDSRPLSVEGEVGLSESPLSQNIHLPPRIHILLNEEPPLNAGLELNGSSTGFTSTLPPVPDQSTYSSRRSRILDAPSISRKSPRSPSPERRYVRTVPRDMVEAARRRGLRARVRTK